MSQVNVHDHVTHRLLLLFLLASPLTHRVSSRCMWSAFESMTISRNDNGCNLTNRDPSFARLQHVYNGSHYLHPKQVRISRSLSLLIYSLLQGSRGGGEEEDYTITNLPIDESVLTTCCWNNHSKLDVMVNEESNHIN